MASSKIQISSRPLWVHFGVHFALNEIHDILIINPDCIPNPGNFVVARLEDDNEAIVRRYKQLSAVKKSHEFELLALNDAWASIRVDNTNKGNTVGAVMSFIRKL